MDSKTFTQKLAANMGYDSKRTADFIDKFAEIDETIVKDHSTGKRIMLPPQLSLEFHPAAMLRKKLSGNE